jgi:glycine/D-amino acid oxidase-like deaminating enzyme
LVRPLGLRVPVYPIKGYSLTANILREDQAPVSTIMDESFKIAITRLGTRIRIGGMAEVSGFNNHLPEARRATLIRSVASLFPGAGDFERAGFWSGRRTARPSWARRPSQTCSSTPGTARWAGPWPAVRRGFWRTSSVAGPRPSMPAI